MLTDVGAIRTYFAKLGLDAEIADIYLALHSHGPQTISELSRNSKIERTHIYRLIDKLMESNLIEVESQLKRGVIKAAPIANLRLLINKKENELKNLQDELGLVEQLLARNSLSSPAARVQFYSGPQGIRQMLWNQLNAKSEIVSLAGRVINENAGNTLMLRWAQEFKRRGLQAKLLLNDDFERSWRSLKPRSRRTPGVQYNYLPDSVFEIENVTAVYDDITTYFNWKNGEVFGIEIYNQEIANAQRQFFELLWPESTPENRI
jgi:sugar-specific transcriptional regulator TrmB